MNRLLQITIAFLTLACCTGAAWGQDWGGTVYQDPDSIDAATILNTGSGYADSNWGALTTVQIGEGSGSITRSFLIRFANDPHTAGYTQDSARLYVTWLSGDPAGANETLVVYCHVLKRDWGEGTKSGTTATTGECSWDSAKVGSIDWTTDGAQSDGNDRQAAVACSVVVVGPLAAATTFSAKIEGTHLTQDFFDYGLVCEWGRDNISFPTMNLYSDDHVTTGNRPYISGYETAPAAGGSALNVGVTNLGPGNYGPSQ